MPDREHVLTAPFDQGVFLLHYNRGREAVQEGRYAEARRELELDVQQKPAPVPIQRNDPRVITAKIPAITPERIAEARHMLTQPGKVATPIPALEPAAASPGAPKAAPTPVPAAGPPMPGP